MKQGDTFLCTVKGFDNHLWIVLSDPLASPNVVIVNLTTHTVDEEQHCVIENGEHPFVKHKTSVRYYQGKVVPLAILDEARKKCLLTNHSPLSAALLGKILTGASASDYLPEECRQLLTDQELI